MARLSGTKHTPGVSISAAMLMVSAGAKQALHVGGCAPTPAPTTPAPTPAPTTLAPTPGALGSDGARTRSVALCLAVAVLGAALS